MNKNLPPIKQLFIESWHTMTRHALSLFLVSIISFVMAFVVALTLVVVVGFVGFSNGFFKLLQNIGNSPDVLTKIPLQMWIIFTVLFLIFFIALGIIGAVSSISQLLIIGQKEGEMTAGQAIQKSFSLIIPLIIAGLIVSFFTFGSFFLFFLPVIFVSFFLSFTQFEVIFSGKKGTAAIRSSVQIISQNFGEIITRYIVYFLAYLLIIVFLPSIFTKFDKNIGMVLSLFMFLIQLLASWYGLVFSLTLYKQAKSITDEKKKVSIVWMTIVSFLGWLIAIMIIVIGMQFATKAIQSGILQKTIDYRRL